MGALRSLLLLSVGVAIGGALLIAHRVSEETGKGLGESFADVPAEAQRIFADIKSRAGEAAARAQEAYGQKQAEIDGFLHGGTAG